MSDQATVIHLIETYRLRWNARDFDGMAALFTEPSAMMYEQGLRPVSDQATMAAGLRGRFEALEADGFDRTEIESVDVEMCSATMAIAYLSNLRRLRADHTVIDAIDAFYICIKQDDVWRLSVGGACDLGWRDPAR